MIDYIVIIGILLTFLFLIFLLCQWLLEKDWYKKMIDLDYKRVIFKKPNGKRLEGFVIDSNFNLYLIKYRQFGIITRKKWVEADDLIRIDGTYVGPEFFDIHKK